MFLPDVQHLQVAYSIPVDLIQPTALMTYWSYLAQPLTAKQLEVLPSLRYIPTTKGEMTEEFLLLLANNSLKSLWEKYGKGESYFDLLFRLSEEIERKGKSIEKEYKIIIDMVMKNIPQSGEFLLPFSTLILRLWLKSRKTLDITNGDIYKNFSSLIERKPLTFFRFINLLQVEFNDNPYGESAFI